MFRKKEKNREEKEENFLEKEKSLQVEGRKSKLHGKTFSWTSEVSSTAPKCRFSTMAANDLMTEIAFD